jgi:hypothetical protein
MIFDYYDGIAEAIKFLVALGSIVGLLGLIVGIIGMFSFGAHGRRYMLPVIIFSLILLAVCGPFTGIEYFQIY